MAEAAGLTVGAIALASLFTTCVQCFDCVQLTRTYGRDHELLITKLEVEKTRLLIWGDAVGIFDTQGSNRDARLDCPHIQPILERTLNCILLIFTDTEKLRKRYGAIPEEEQSTALSANRMNIFRASFTTFQARVQDLQQQASLQSKIRWAIHDRDKFTTMVSDLRQFIDGLRNITDSSGVREVEHRMVGAEIERLPQIASLGLIQEACADEHSDWSEAASLRLGQSVTTGQDQDVVEWLNRQSTSETPDIQRRVAGIRPSLPSMGSMQSAPAPTGRPTSKLTGDSYRSPEMFIVSTAETVNQNDISVTDFHVDPFVWTNLIESVSSTIDYSYIDTSGVPSPATVAKIYVYCPLGQSYVRMAARITLDVPNTSVLVRIDDRLCPGMAYSSTDHLHQLKSLHLILRNSKRKKWLTGPEAESNKGAAYATFDRQWIEQRIYEIESEEDEPEVAKEYVRALYNTHKGDNRVAAIIILGEPSLCDDLTAQPPFLTLKKGFREAGIYHLTQRVEPTEGDIMWKPSFIAKLSYHPRDPHGSQKYQHTKVGETSEKQLDAQGMLLLHKDFPLKLHNQDEI